MATGIHIYPHTPHHHSSDLPNNGIENFFSQHNLLVTIADGSKIALVYWALFMKANTGRQ